MNVSIWLEISMHSPHPDFIHLAGRDPRAALDLFRRVIEECHGFLVVHSDPSILFTPLIRNKDGTWSPQNLSGPDERLFRNWSGRKNDSVSYTAPK